MFLYNVRIALKSLRRNPVLTAIIISGIALGICISTTFTTVRHLFARNPIPGKSERIYHVRLDNWEKSRPYPGDSLNSLPPQVTYRDAMELMRSKIPIRQTASFKAMMTIFPDPKVARPSNEAVRLVFSDFFPLFNVPFKYGSGWDRKADATAEQVVVIDSVTNEKLFGGANSVGKTIRIDDRMFQVVGVLDQWRPSIRFYDLTQNYIQAPEPIFIPFNLVRPMRIGTSGNSDGWKGSGNTFDDFLASETTWIQYWVELESPEKRDAYVEFVNNYTRDQKRFGRFERPLNNRVDGLTDYMRELNVTPPQVNAMTVVSILFLVVCSLNLMGLLLGKFLARAPEVSVRRALGASKRSVFIQHIVECELVGVIGGTIGILLSLLILSAVEKMFPIPVEISLTGEMVLTAVFLSLVAGLIAGIYPAWRICTIQPAMQLKVQ